MQGRSTGSSVASAGIAPSRMHRTAPPGALRLVAALSLTCVWLATASARSTAGIRAVTDGDSLDVELNFVESAAPLTPCTARGVSFFRSERCFSVCTAFAATEPVTYVQQ
jgi:hypothetical protein